MRLLVVEDMEELRTALEKGLHNKGYKVETCEDGSLALERCLVESYDLIVLDLGLPKINGEFILKSLRETDRETPVLILSARGNLEDKVKLLDMGASDYLTKPFEFDELEARIRSLVRRQFIQHDTILKCGDMTFDTKMRRLEIKNEALKLTKKETDIIEFLMYHQGEILSSEKIMEHVWGEDVDSFSNVIRVHMSSLRKKISQQLLFDPIQNKVGEGYILRGEIK